MPVKKKGPAKTISAARAERQAQARAVRKRCRPLDFDLEKVEYLAGLGLTQAKIAMAIGCAERTIRQRLHDIPEFAEAYSRGRVSREKLVASKLQERIEAGDTSAIKFYLSCQCGWKEASKVEAEVHGKVALEHDLSSMSIAQLMELAGESEE